MFGPISLPRVQYKFQAPFKQVQTQACNMFSLNSNEVAAHIVLQAGLAAISTRAFRLFAVYVVGGDKGCLAPAYSEPPLVPIRLAWFWMSNYMTQIVSAFLATGILQLRGHNGVMGWRYLFLIEEIFTCLCGLFSFALCLQARRKLKYGSVQAVGSRNGERWILVLCICICSLG